MEVKFDGVKKSEPDRDDGFKVGYASAKRLGFQLRWRLMILIVLSPLLFMGWFFIQDRLLVRADGILTTEPIQLRAFKTGFVSDIAVSPGDQIVAGQLLFDLSSPEIDQQIEVWIENLTMLSEYREEMLADVSKTLSDFGEKLETSREEQDAVDDSYDKLAKKGLFRLSDQMQLSELNRSLSQEEKQFLLDAIRVESLRYTHDLSVEIRDIEMEIAIAKVKQKQLDVRSAQAGVLNRLYVNEGEFVAEGEPLAEVSNYRSPVVNVYLKPERMSYAKVGETVTITLPDRSRYSGTIKEPPSVTETVPASLAGPFEGSSRLIKVVVEFDEAPEVWFEGLPVKVKF